MAFEKTINLTGTEVCVKINGKNCDVRNDSNATVYVSRYGGIAPDADEVLSVPAGQAVKYCGLLGAVYLLGTGKVQICGNNNSSPVFKYAAAPSGVGGVSGTALNIQNSAEFPLLEMKLYGKSTQDGTPTPEAPVDIVNVGDSGSVVVTVNDGGENSLSASLTSALPLCGIPVTSGGNYTDSKGQQWICDELVYRPDGTGKVVKKILKRNASDLPFESADISGYSTPPERMCFYFNYVGKKTNSTAVICNRFKTGSYKETSEVNIVGAETITLLFGISGEIARSLDDLKTWFSQNPTYLLYERATPEEIELTAEEMAQLKALYSYSGVTNISNDAGAEMVVKYCNSPLVSEYYLPIVKAALPADVNV